MLKDTTIIRFRQPDAIDDPLSELAREGARRMLAQALIAEADTFVALWKDLKLPDGRDPRRASRPWAASRDPDRRRACRGSSRQGPRPGRRGRGGEDPLHLVDPAEVGAADEESRRAVACSLLTRGVDRRLPGGARRPLGQGRAEPVASGDLAADGGMAGGLRCLAETRPLGAAIRVRVGGWGLLAGPDGTGRRVYAGADRRDPRGQEGIGRLPDRGARERTKLA